MDNTSEYIGNINGPKSEVLEAIRVQLMYWIDYAENDNHTEEYRREHDLDCILTDGNLYADTIFSLWTPLKNVLKYYGYNYTSKLEDKKKILNNLEDLLDSNETIVKKLCILFELGRTRANVMILPDRKMQSRGGPPYWDYMPYFLYECYKGGAFSQYFTDDQEFIAWIEDQNLRMFFKNEEDSKDAIIDLAGTGDIKDCSFKHMDIECMLDSYINILQMRLKYF